ncbi:hypothetical protein RISK_004276 [Rhodopirellula islandica]|uniref:Uncharacterized protein n=1 Tax=Rhodopirellula islandica TaxID=595434 RepID=A0A0J1EEE9_RHOIS|nr:hypothetical protein RISK_004276 [Rhodopirellula islandica]
MSPHWGGEQRSDRDAPCREIESTRYDSWGTDGAGHSTTLRKCGCRAVFKKRFGGCHETNTVVQCLRGQSGLVSITITITSAETGRERKTLISVAA